MKHLTILISILFSTFLSLDLHAQNIEGKVIDEHDEPLAYANVILQKADSTYLGGTITDITGGFVIAAHPDAARVQVSFIGYETVYRSLDNLTLIKIAPDTEVLGKAVVKATLPKSEIKGDAIVTKIENSVLSEAGSANDILQKLPGVTLKDDAYEVFGKGTPMIYINGRQVRDNAELELLNSNEIKHVEIVRNPGSRYDATVRAVIRIQTVRHQGEGFGFDLRSTIYQAENTDLIESVNMNYRYKGLDIFGSFNYTRNDWFQKAQIDESLQSHQLLYLEQKAEFTGLSKNLTPIAGINYQFNDNHSIGLRYRPDVLISGRSTNHVFTTATIDGVVDDISETKAEGYNDPKTDHQLNFYYNGTVGKLNIDLNADILNGRYSDIKKFEEFSEIQENRILNTSNYIRNKLYASKLILSYPIAKGSLSAGAEYSYIHRTDDYSNPEGYVPSTKTAIQEDNMNVFMDFVYPFNFGMLSAGVRYEYLSFNYYQNDVYQSDQSRTYGNVYPNISFNATAGEVDFMLSYAVKTQRPSYHQLRNSVTYMNKYCLEIGNPYLQPETVHDVTFVTMWNFIEAGGSYQNLRNTILQSGFPVEGTDNQILVTTYNLEQNIPIVTAFVYLNPTISFWSPVIGASMEKQWLTIEYLSQELKFNKPMFQFEFGNTFNIRKGFMISADYTYTSTGYWRDYLAISPAHRIDISIRKSFFNDALSLELRGHDLLRAKDDYSNKTGIHTISQDNIRDTRKASLTLRYKFNSARSKYKGTGAGDQQKSRM